MGVLRSDYDVCILEDRLCWPSPFWRTSTTLSTTGSTAVLWSDFNYFSNLRRLCWPSSSWRMSTTLSTTASPAPPPALAGDMPGLCCPSCSPRLVFQHCCQETQKPPLVFLWGLGGPISDCELLCCPGLGALRPVSGLMLLLCCLGGGAIRSAWTDTSAVLHRTHRPEKTSTKHSWNGNWLLTNSVIFRLQRHSDHHAYASRPYQVRGPDQSTCEPMIPHARDCPPTISSSQH